MNMGEKLSLKELDKVLEKVTEEVQKINDLLYEMPELDGYYSDIVDDLKKGNKMPKKQRKELALKMVKERCPKFCKLMDEMDLIAEGMKNRVDEVGEKFDDIDFKLDEIEEMKDDLERRKDELDL